MRAWILAAALAAGAAVVWFLPSEREVTATFAGETVELTAPCAAAPVDLFRYGIAPDVGSGWLVAADGSGVFAPQGPCRPAAWWRTVLGAVLTALAVFVVVRSPEQRRRPSGRPA